MSMTEAKGELRILTFNVWGLAVVAKDRPVRIRAIAENLAAATEYDVVCLQEIWMYTDFEIVRDEVSHSLPFSRFFHTGALGSGLAVFSRFPFISAHALPYALSGSPHQAIAGDFFVKKAAATVVLLHPVLGEVEIWNTHMHAAGENPPDTRQAHRMAQAWQLANEIRNGAARGRYVFAMGDFNSQPFSIPIALLRTHAGMRDSFLDVHPRANDIPPSSSSSSGSLSPRRAIATLGMTCDSTINSYSAGKNIPRNITAQGGKRLDYIFYREPEPARRRPLIWGVRGGESHGDGRRSGEGSSNNTGAIEEGKPITSSVDHAPRVRCVRSEVVMTGLVPGTSHSYSDHFALASTFVIEQTIAPAPAQAPDLLGQEGSPSGGGGGASFTPLLPLISDPDPLNPTITTFTNPEDLGVSSTDTSAADAAVKASTIRTALHTLKGYNMLAARTWKLHLRFLGLALVALGALTVGSAWQPKSWLQPIFTLVAGVLGAAAATFLYTGWVWGRWEQGLLTETMEEMELELRVVEMSTGS